MTEADILALTYGDKCTVTRKIGAVKDEDTKQTRQETVTVASDVPCALSTAKGGGLDLSEGHGRTQSGYTLFCHPDVDIRAGDKLLVITVAGREHTLWAGRPLTFAGSHAEIPMLEELRA
jgi:hypothetical protein